MTDRGALICDTGAILDYVVTGASDHDRFLSAMDRARVRIVPGLVLAEVDHFLRRHRAGMRVLMEELARGAFVLVPPDLRLLLRAMEIDRQYEALQLGLVDASIVALAEQIGVVRIATRDVRDFSAVKLRDGRSFDLVVEPSAPDLS